MTRRAALISMLACTLLALSAPARGETLFSLVMGVNRPLSKNTPTLLFADDDAIQFHRLLSTLGRSILLVDADESTRRLYGRIEGARRPSRKNFDRALEELLTQVRLARKRGERPHLLFVYSGHGEVKNNEGYLALADGRLFASDLSEQVLQRSAAVSNHVIIDACKSFYLVQEKRVGGRRKRLQESFYRPSSLVRRFPNTGFLLSTSSGASSHEWEEFRAGIFSHEVRSGLMGPADVNQDGRVSYNEIFAFVQVANKKIANDRFRPRIYMRAPRGKGSQALLDLRSSTAAALLTVPRTRPGRYMLEDNQGVRLADLNTDAAEPVTLLLPGRSRYYLHDMGRAKEYRIEPAGKTVALASLTARPSSYRAKGAAHEAFLKIFSVPFNRKSFDQALRAPAVQVARPSDVPIADQERARGLLSVTYDLRSGYLDQAGLVQGVRLGYSHSLGPLELGGAIGYGHSAYTRDDQIDVTLDELGAAAVLEYRLGIWQRLRLVAGLDLGLCWGWQQGVLSNGTVRRIHNPFFRFQGRLGAELRLSGPALLIVSGQLGQTVLEKSAGYRAPVSGGMNLGLGLEL